MIIVITGPTASGKTSTCWSLMSHFERLVFLDSDFMGFRKPFDYHSNADLDVLYQQLIYNLRFQFDRGERCFAVTLTAHMAIMFPTKTKIFEEFGLPLKAFRFRCASDELKRRISLRDRGSVQVEKEMRNYSKSSALLDHAFPNDKVFDRIDTTNIEEDEVALEIYKRIQQP